MHPDWTTADLYDHYGDHLQVLTGVFHHFGRKTKCHGQIATLSTFEDNTHVRTILDQEGLGKVLVIQGHGSLRYALLGDQLATLAVKHHWSGVIVNGCIRDAEAIDQMDLFVLALGTNPRKTKKEHRGEMEVPVEFGHVHFRQGAFLAADRDGVVVFSQEASAGLELSGHKEEWL
jgi:regulator of ribonuclease activity A